MKEICARSQVHGYSGQGMGSDRKRTSTDI